MARARVAVVTGAASGIGRAVAERWLASGGSVVAVDLDRDGLAWAGSQVEPRQIVSVAGDVTTEATNAEMVAVALEHFGRVDTLVLNAGLPMAGPLDALPMEAFDRALAVNLRALVLGLRAGLPALRASEAAAVVATASVSGLGGDPGMWAYNAAKGGVVNFVRAASLDLAADGIRVNAVCPGPIRTAMTRPIIEGAPDLAAQLVRNVPLRRWGEAEEVASVIVFLASPEASFVTGAIVPVDGGITASSGQFLPGGAGSD